MARNNDTFEEKLELLNELLQESAQRSLTPDEIREQRISYAMGILPHDSTATREETEALVDKQLY